MTQMMCLSSWGFDTYLNWGQLTGIVKLCLEPNGVWLKIGCKNHGWWSFRSSFPSKWPYIRVDKYVQYLSKIPFSDNLIAYHIISNHIIIYILYTYYIHIIYILYTYYIHILYILYTYYIHIIYILYTYYIHIIYILYTYYIHIIYILYTYYIHIIYILYTYYIHIIYILYTYYLHIIYILYTYYIHIIYILYTYYIHIIYILYTYYLHIIYILYTYYIHIIYIYIISFLYHNIIYRFIYIYSITYSKSALCPHKMVDTFTSPRRGNSGEVARLAELLKKNGPRGPTPLAYRIRQLTGRLRKVWLCNHESLPPVVGICCDLCAPQIYE